MERDPNRRAILTMTERLVLSRVASGQTADEIAAALGKSAGTIRTYKDRITKKLRCRGSVAQVLVAGKLGEIDLEAIADELVRRHGWMEETTETGENDEKPAADEEEGAKSYTLEEWSARVNQRQPET